MSAQTSADVQALIDSHGWGPALERIADEAPSLPDGAVDVLRGTGLDDLRRIVADIKAADQ